MITTCATAAATTSFPSPAIHHSYSFPCQRRTILTSNYHVLPSNMLLLSLKPKNHILQIAAAREEGRSEEADRIVDGMDFGELCNEFECISSPLVESTARQLVRDIIQLRQGNRALGTFSVSVTYKDPVRSFTGRDKYKRPLWITYALYEPSVVSSQFIIFFNIHS
ncbi:hypothetical protein LINPERPRIM_LOCUS11211 [Linum perenne]